MPRPPRSVTADLIYHVLNRGNGRMRLFHKDADFDAFAAVLAEGLGRYPVDLLTYCLMPNHWHLVLRPRKDAALSDLMRWVGVTHVRRHHEHYHTRGGGHLYQGRFKSFPIERDGHLLRVCRYVEANAFRAGLVRRAEDWTWGGRSNDRAQRKTLTLAEWPVDRPGNWSALVNLPIEESELERIRQNHVNRGRPFGNEDWTEKTAQRLGLSSTLRSVGRPKSVKNQ